MLSLVYSAGLQGIHAYRVAIETRIDRSIHKYFLVGLAEKAVKESFSRISSAIKSSGFHMPGGKITQNLAPADIPKEGTGFDLSLAMGIIAADGDIDPIRLQEFILVGELALDGTLRPSRGILSIAMSMKFLSQSKLIVPSANAREAAMAQQGDVWGVDNLRQAVEIISHPEEHEAVRIDIKNYFHSRRQEMLDFSEVKGQYHVKRSLEV